MTIGFPATRTGTALYSSMLGILDRLVAFDTTSHLSNLALLDYVRELLAGNGIESRLFYNDDRSKANLVATAGPRDAGHGIVWSGHTDVVPVDGQAWTADPFKLRLTDDLAIGRGTADMKGFIACCLALLSAVDQKTLASPVTLVLTYEEEIGCVGARRLVEEMRTWAGDTVGCIVGEPTGMNVVVGHKGKQNYRIRFTAQPRHAALAPESANPVVTAAKLAVFADALNERFRADGPHDPRFAIGHSWINVGRVDGGVKPNIVPELCTVELEIRTIPGHSCDEVADELRRHIEDELLPPMRKWFPEATARVERLSDTPSFAMDAAHPFVELVRASAGRAAAPQFVPFGTEAGLFHGLAGLPTVVLGPGYITEAHTPDESVPLEQLRKCLAQLQALPLTRPDGGADGPHRHGC